jgi:hypothetical protein
MILVILLPPQQNIASIIVEFSFHCKILFLNVPANVSVGILRFLGE